jgi:alanyl-tRNA synthetase
MTELMYIEYPDLFEQAAQIINCGNDSRGRYLILNQSIFYPQGGGQPADQGEMIANNTVYKVFDVRNVDGEIRHYTTDDIHVIHPGDNIKMKVDKNRRMINSKYHTAGHLIAAVAERVFSELRAIKGHQFPGEAYVEFDGTVSELDDFLHMITTAVKESIASNAIVKIEELSSVDINQIAENLPYILPKDKALRVCHIEGFSPVPCGGTHVRTLKDLIALNIKGYKSKKGKTKIYYEILQ